MAAFRNGALSKQVSILHAKIRNELSQVDSIAVTVEKRGSNRFVVCHFYGPQRQTRYVCIDVITNQDLSSTLSIENDAVDCDTSPQDESTTNRVVGQNARHLSNLYERIANNLSFWKMREKVSTVLIAEKEVGSSGMYEFLPESKCGDIERSRSLRENFTRGVSDESSKSSRRTAPSLRDCATNGSPQVDVDGNGNVNGMKKIVVLPCMSETLERIVGEMICGHEGFARRFTDPMSRVMFKALMDREFANEVASCWTARVQLPIRNTSLDEMRFIFNFFEANMEAIEKAIGRSGENEVIDMSEVENADMRLMRQVFNEFWTSVCTIRGRRAFGGAQFERLSAALPIFGDLARGIEKGIQQASCGGIGEMLREAVVEIRGEMCRMEKDGMISCATLLDPRFKREAFSSKMQCERVECMVEALCEMEGRRRMRENNNSNNSLEHVMDSMICERDNGNWMMCGLGTYLSERTILFDADVEEYWDRNATRWPLLAAVAARYWLIPCCCCGLECAARRCGGGGGVGGGTRNDANGSEGLGGEDESKALGGNGGTGSSLTMMSKRGVKSEHGGDTSNEVVMEFLWSNLLLSEQSNSSLVSMTKNDKGGR